MVIFAHFSVLGHQTTMNTRLDELSYISLSGIHNFNPLPGHKGANNPILWWKITKNGYFQIYTSESIRRSQFLNLNYITSFVATQMLIMDSNVCSILWYDSKAEIYGIMIIWCSNFLKKLTFLRQASDDHFSKNAFFIFSKIMDNLWDKISRKI